MNRILTFSIAILAILLSSCVLNLNSGIEGHGDVVTTNRDVDNFNKIKVSSGLDLYISQGDELSVSVKTYENLQDYVVTRIENGKLKIYCEERIRADIKRIDVTVKDLESLDCSAGSDTWTVDTLQVDEIKISVSSGADATVSVNAENVICDTSSGAGAKLSGETNTFDCDASSGSNINAYGLQSITCSADASSGADIRVYVTSSFSGSASSGGGIDYKGNPKSTNSSKSSGGRIHAH